MKRIILLSFILFSGIANADKSTLLVYLDNEYYIPVYRNETMTISILLSKNNIINILNFENDKVNLGLTLEIKL